MNRVRPQPARDGSRLPQCLIAPASCPRGAEPLAHLGDREGMLVLHGFTGSPWEVRPIAEALAARGHTVAMPLLAGHGTSIYALDETTWRDWLASATAALHWLDAHCDRVHFVGLSMGSLLSLLLAQQRPPPRTGALVLCAPALTLRPLDRAFIEICARVGWPKWIGKDDPQLPGGARPPCYQALPLRAARQLLDLMGVVRATVRRREGDVLVLHGSADLTVPMAPAMAIARQILGPGAQLRSLPGAGHLLPRDACASEVIARTLAFVGQHIAAHPLA